MNIPNNLLSSCFSHNSNTCEVGWAESDWSKIIQPGFILKMELELLISGPSL